MRGVYCDAVATRLQGEGGVEDESFGTADAKVRVNEYDILLARAFGGGLQLGGGREGLGWHRYLCSVRDASVSRPSTVVAGARW